MQQMRSRVIAHGRLPNLSIHHRINLIPNPDPRSTRGTPFLARILREKWGLHHHLMRPHSLYRRITSSNVGYDSIVIVRIKPSPVANLPARLGIKRRVIKDDLTGFSSLKFLRPLPVMNDGQHFAAVRASLPITFKYRFRKLLVRRIRSLFRRAFPGSARKSLLLL